MESPRASTVTEGNQILVRGQRRALELIAGGKPLREVLDALCGAIEENLPGTRTSVLLIEAGRIRHAAAPSLPAGFCTAVDGALVGPAAGSCGTAAYRKASVVVEDVHNDPLWAGYRHVANAFGLSACASVPIFGAERAVVGTFAIYHDRPGPFTALELEVLEAMTGVAATAILHHRREQALAASQRALREARRQEGLTLLAGGVAHDFNNVLSAMLGITNLLQAKLASEPGFGPMLGDLESLVGRASDFVQQLLVYSGRARVEGKVIDLNRLVGEMQRLVVTGGSGGVSWRLELDPRLPVVRGDTAQLEAVVLNLLSNAIEAFEAVPDGASRPEPPTIQIATSTVELDGQSIETDFPGQRLSPGNFVVLNVRDNGAGMSAEALEHAFEPFFSSKGAGRGLGLATSQGILRSHGGGYRLLSTLGVGTTVTVYLPVAEAASEAAVAPPASTEAAAAVASAAPAPDLPPAARGGQRHTVLLVDDEEAIRRTAGKLIQALGHVVHQAASAREAITFLEAYAADVTLVLLDLVMPEMGGRQAATIIRERWPRLVVVLSSGYDRESGDDPTAGLPGTRFLQKPYGLSALEAVLGPPDA